MIPTKLRMGEVIASLAEQRATTTERLRHFEELEHFLAEAERRLATKRVSMDVLLTKVPDRQKMLQATLAWEANLLAQLKSIK